MAGIRRQEAGGRARGGVSSSTTDRLKDLLDFNFATLSANFVAHRLMRPAKA